MTKLSAKSFVMTERDIEIIRLIHACGWLNTTQIIKVMFPPATDKPYQLWSAQGQRRLKHLRIDGFLTSTVPLMEMGKGKESHIYSAGKRAYDTEIIAAPIIPRPEVWTKYYKHEKAIRDVFTDMLRASAIAGIAMPAFKSTRVLKSETTAYISDWYVSLSFDSGNPYHIFVEVDRGEETQAQWRRKISAINDYCDSETYQSIYVHYRARWITIATTEARMQSLIEWTEAEGGKSRFWFTTFDKLNPCTAFTEPIWSVCGQQGLHHLSKTRQ